MLTIANFRCLFATLSDTDEVRPALGIVRGETRPRVPISQAFTLAGCQHFSRLERDKT